MAGDLSISVVIASHGRPDWLARCLTAVRQLDYPAFEVVLVTDASTLDHLKGHNFLAFCKVVPISDTNVSVARNAGAFASSGDIVAFIDDDAVPEPLWLHHHAEALVKTGAAASAGYVRGRNGISYQSRLQSVDAEAETHVEPFSGIEPAIPNLSPGRALKLVGTNATYRRDVFLSLGGFDPAFRYFLEDSDLSLRLASAGFRAAIAPLAEVHHGFAASPRRAASRCPLDLSDIGRSTAIFARRHPSVPRREVYERMFRRERARMIRHMVRGNCEPRDVFRILESLRSGWLVGLDADLAEIRPDSSRGDAFKFVPSMPPEHFVITSRLLRRRRRISEAESVVRAGHRASVFSFSLTPVRHHVRYLDSGVWLQTGGQFGRSERGSAWLRWCRFAKRFKVELARVALQRGIGDTRISGDAAGPSRTTSGLKVTGSRPLSGSAL